MPTFLAPLDLTGSELRNAVIQNLGSDPSSPSEGRLWYDSAGHVLKYRGSGVTIALGNRASDITDLGALATKDTVANVDIDGAAAIALSKLATDPLARANHTGSQLASTISNFDTQVRTSRLDQMANPTAAVVLNGQKITGLATPTADADAATKAYADSIAQGLDVKTAVRVASTANVNRTSPGAAIDGVTLTAGDRVLLKNQTTPSQNGLYVFNGAASTMTRTADADAVAEVRSGMFTFVTDGATNADRGFVLTTDNPITLDTTALTFTQFSSAGSVTGTADRISVTGNQVDIAATYAGQTSLTTLGTVGTGTWQGTAVGVAYGGTGATTAAAARTALGTPGKYAATLGNGSSTTFTVTHNLGTEDVAVELYDATTKLSVYANVTRASTNTLTVDGFTTAPASNSLRCVVVG
jgi:hypothetical protein